MDESKLRVFIYVRISRDRIGARVGVDRQERECRDLADRLGLNVVEVFADNDKSAYNGKPRPNYIRMMAALRASQADAVIAWHTDRLHRSPTELNAYIEVCEPRDVPTYTVKAGKIDLSTAGGRMQARIYADIARYEVEHMVERITAAKRDAARQGKWSGGGRPYAYEADGITIRDDEADIIKQCVKRINAGDSQLSVVRWLNQTGKLTMSGKPWQIGNLKRTLLKKRYVIGGKCPKGCPEGCTIHHGIREHEPENGGPKTEHPAVWPGFISLADYELMVLQLQKTAQPWEHGPIKGRVYLLSGLAFCGACGAPMYGQNRKQTNGQRQRRYRCKPNDNHGGPLGCGKLFRDATALDAFVTEAVLARFDSPEVAGALAQNDDADRAHQLAEELLKLKLRRKDIAAKLALASDDEQEDFSHMLATVRDAQAGVQDQLYKLQRQQNAQVLPASGALRAAWERGDIDWRRSVIKLVVDRIEVLPGHPHGKRWGDYMFDPDKVIIRWLH
jgi:site-specific DNA recombinase